LLEAWNLDSSRDLYGQKIEVELVEWLRPERKLDGLEALKAQIALDEQAARKVLA
jgi:riboflavin kinase/FMN adenylyltransferase